MNDNIPWLDSSELIDADADVLATSHNQDSLLPVEFLVAPKDSADLPLPGVPKHSGKAAFVTVGLLCVAVTALALRPGTAHVRRARVLAHGASLNAPTQPAPRPLAITKAEAQGAAVGPQLNAVVSPATQPPAQVSPPVAVVPPTLANAHVSTAPVAVPRPRHLALRAAFASLNAGKPREALERARAILDFAPERADAWLVLGSAYDALHDRESALAAFRSCALHARGPALGSCQQLARD